MPKPQLISISISGPEEVIEGSNADYKCTAHYSNGRTKDVTGDAIWSENSKYAGFTNPGILTTLNVPENITFEINASYKGKSTNLTVTIKDQDSPPSPPPTPEGRMVIDPITRIEGHLRIETQVSDGKVAQAWSTGTLFRGVEPILKDRNPEDAWLFTQRLCGVCTYVHGSTSVRCVEDALNLTVPVNARIIRNLLMGSQYMHDHIIHFYHLHALDWVDVVSALGADPAETTNLASKVTPKANSIDFAAVKDRLQTFESSKQLGPFANAYWGHPEYVLTPEENLLLAAHYLEALKLQAHTARMHAIFGGKNPHIQSLRVGGVTCRRDINNNRISEFHNLLQETKHFIDTVYVPDVEFLATAYNGSRSDMDWSKIGGNQNFLSFGEFPLGDVEPDDLFFPRGAILDGGSIEDVDLSEIAEHVRHSWYSGTTARHPSAGETDPRYTKLDTDDRYSWLKAPRYKSEPMEVGPLARVMVGYRRGKSVFVNTVNGFLSNTKLPAEALFSTLGRTAARCLETKIIADAMGGWLNQLNAGGGTMNSWTMPSKASGMGLNEAPRGALGHWININNQVIANYQMVVPSTWNFGPRCAADNPGPAESALQNTP
ncbi:MAG: nickel-dependent hydrogenase large subunit, partial [Desulfobacterales bacterium]